MVRVWSHSLLFVLLAVTYRSGFASSNDGPAKRQQLYEHETVFGHPFGSPPYDSSYGAPYNPPYVAPYDSSHPAPYNPPYGAPYGSPYDPSYGSPYGDYYPYPYPTQKPRRSKISPVLLVLMLTLLRSKTATTVAATTTADPCPWSTWTPCSAPCGGNTTRSRTCSGVSQVQNVGCNVAVAGYQPDGWYRAINCYEYSWRIGSVAYAAAVTGCTNLGAKLAGKGMRNDEVRGDVLAKFASSIGTNGGRAWLGLTDSVAEGSWVWSDDVTANPTFWAGGQPDAAPNTVDCATVAIGNAFSLDDVDCAATNANYICERAAT